jgi:FixJ family two-component response regulator
MVTTINRSQPYKSLPVLAYVPKIFVVDDDISVRESLEFLFLSEGLQVETFTTAKEFLDHPRTVSPSCLVLDINLSGLSGLDLQKQIAVEVIYMPIIFITGYGDVPMTVQAMKAGAIEFLTKPFNSVELLRTIRNAIELSQAVLIKETEKHLLLDRYASLTPREREVMALVVSGLLNKQVGGKLGISEVTVKAHRGNVMRKMGVLSFAGLVRMATSISQQAPNIFGNTQVL